MPESKHHRKGRSHSEWRRRRNIARAEAKNEKKAELRRAMAKMMQQQMIAEAELEKKDD